MIRRPWFFVFSALLSMVPWIAGAATNPHLTLHLDKKEIRVSQWYGGASLGVSGWVEPGWDLILQLEGRPRTASLRLKEKRGLFWLSGGAVTFRKVPWLIQTRATKPLAALLPSAEAEKLGLGRAGTAARIGVPAKTDRGLLTEELLRLKETGGLFDFKGGKIERTKSGRYYAVFALPPAAPPGAYLVRAYALKNRVLMAKDARTLTISRVGLPAFLGRMARLHAFFYGAVSVAMAMFLGLLAGLIFRKRED